MAVSVALASARKRSDCSTRLRSARSSTRRAPCNVRSDTSRRPERRRRPGRPRPESARPSRRWVARAVAGKEQRVVGQADDHPFPEGPAGGILGRMTGLFVDDVEHRAEGPPFRVFGLPAGQGGGDRVEKGDPAAGVGGDDGIADARQGGAKQLCAAAG